MKILRSLSFNEIEEKNKGRLEISQKYRLQSMKQYGNHPHSCNPTLGLTLKFVPVETQIIAIVQTTEPLLHTHFKNYTRKRPKCRLENLSVF